MSLRYHPKVRIFRSLAEFSGNAVHWYVMANRQERLSTLVWQGGFLLALLLVASGVAWLVNFSAWLILFFIGALLLIGSGGAGSKLFTIVGGIFLALGIGSLFEVSFDLPGTLLAALGTTLVLAGDMLRQARTWLIATGLAFLILGVVVYLQSLGLPGYIIGVPIVYAGLATLLQVRTSRTEGP